MAQTISQVTAVWPKSPVQPPEDRWKVSEIGLVRWMRELAGVLDCNSHRPERLQWLPGLSSSSFGCRFLSPINIFFMVPRF